MRILRSIRVWSDNLDELRKLECLRSVIVDGVRGITCHIKDNRTTGSLVAHSGDWLVEYETGMWQRFGDTAHSTLVFNPANSRFHGN